MWYPNETHCDIMMTSRSTCLSHLSFSFWCFRLIAAPRTLFIWRADAMHVRRGQVQSCCMTKQKWGVDVSNISLDLRWGVLIDVSADNDCDMWLCHSRWQQCTSVKLVFKAVKQNQIKKKEEKMQKLAATTTGCGDYCSTQRDTSPVVQVDITVIITIFLQWKSDVPTAPSEIIVWYFCTSSCYTDTVWIRQKNVCVVEVESLLLKNWHIFVFSVKSDLCTVSSVAVNSSCDNNLLLIEDRRQTKLLSKIKK